MHRIASSEFKTFTTSKLPVKEIESDSYINGNILYSEGKSLKTSNGSATQELLSLQYDIGDFTQISETEVVYSITARHCLFVFNRIKKSNTRFAGSCGSFGYRDGNSGMFNAPLSVEKGTKDSDILFVVDKYNHAIRRVAITDKSINTLTSLGNFPTVASLVQEEASGDILMLSGHQVIRVRYRSHSIEVVAGSPAASYKDGSFHRALFNSPSDITQIGPETFLVADEGNDRIRILDFDSKTASTLKVQTADCGVQAASSFAILQSCADLKRPSSLLVTNSSMFVKSSGEILRCMYSY